MATIVTRSGKGSPLTHAEVDANFTNLNTDKLELSGGTMTGNLSFGDNDKAIFGAGSDLQIYSDGTTGQIVGDVNITGTLTSDGLTVDGAIQVNATVPSLVLEETDTTDINGQVAVVSGITHIRTINDAGNSVTNRLSVNNSTGDISFYEDTGTTAKFFWDASAERLGIGDGTNTPPRTLHLKNDVPSIRLTDSTANDYAEIVSTDGDLFLRADHGNTHAGSRLRLQVDGTDALYIDDSLNVGIGTISPAVTLEVNDSSSNTSTGVLRLSNIADSISTGTDVGRLEFYSGDNSSGGNSVVGSIGTSINGNTNAADMKFNINGTERMRIDSSGRVGIGTSSPTYALDVFSSSSSIAAEFQTNQSASYITFNDTGTTLGNVRVGSASNQLLFLAGGSEAMRIDSSGNLLVGMTSPSSNSRGAYLDNDGFVSFTRDDDRVMVLGRGTGSGTNGDILEFRKDGGTVGSIGVSASSTSYNTSSDHRLKENVVELTGATDRLKQLEPKRFNFIVDADTTVDGFLAHEVQTVVPEAITGTHNEVDADGNPVYQGIDQSKLVPLLVATIKELEARITALENA